MGRELIVAWAGRHQRDDWERLCAGYRRRIRRLAAVRDLPVRARARGAGGRRRLRAEGEALLAALPEPCRIVAVDRRARSRTSVELAEWLEGTARDWPHPVAFLVGSDLGLADEVFERARDGLSLGPLTLPHELARLVLYEQIYRALAIRAGIKYHREPL